VDEHRLLSGTKHKGMVDNLKENYGDRFEKDSTVELPNHLSKFGSVRVFMGGCDLLCEELKGPVIIDRDVAQLSSQMVRKPC
jgi:hypothetical protein